MEWLLVAYKLEGEEWKGRTESRMKVIITASPAVESVKCVASVMDWGRCT